jgi:hypothetical protein
VPSGTKIKSYDHEPLIYADEQDHVPQLAWQRRTRAGRHG